mmetsp:Transcript_40825/g.79936  ORF Transcript_40825/g.79936 Transcript_40825/m.79936 type:complete len:163 (-) Transcript_40825:17-505(-)|eukprot:CAMPEP_0173383270 /NCGR_PEP_ID=MMETSP1356-20130122/5831_1 /TAXON_ID=77927 ORGANISM="Hemiselmis virescens, Strain PCC157" /NCGR_SAMPLE_ID=MMETSP1356 /ASSEMBLY_ACC=CAM_ASM_000847 /LENGTH=162 /DNA_ID=CAMNT_0014338053 /DNA_START=174 /DNA_END=662 /DNA_ORIENTATION=-
MPISVVRADYGNAEHAKAIEAMLLEYSMHPMGGGEAIPADKLSIVVSELAKRPFAFSVLAFADDGRVAGLANCIEGFSTFAAAALVNIHDLAVSKDFMKQGVSQMLMAKVEEEARARGAVKLTLEVLEGNGPAQGSYRKFGFAPYELDAAMGKALFWQKKIA